MQEQESVDSGLETRFDRALATPFAALDWITATLPRRMRIAYRLRKRKRRRQ